MYLRQLNPFALLLCLIISGCSTLPPPSEDDATLKLLTARYGHGAISDNQRIYVFAGAGHQGFLSDIEIINPQTQRVVQLKNKLIPRRFLSAVWDGNESVYLVGGISSLDGKSHFERRIEVFNTRTYQVEIINAPHPVPRMASAIFWQEKLFIMGGSITTPDGGQWVPWTWVYDVKARRWMRARDMPTAKGSRAAVEHNNKLYIAGGYDGNNALSVFERFDPRANKWQTLKNLPVPISANSAVVKQNKLYLFGDYQKLDASYMYDFDTQLWQQTEFNYQPSRHNTAVSFNDAIYVIGGNTTSHNRSALDSIQVFEL